MLQGLRGLLFPLFILLQLLLGIGFSESCQTFNLIPDHTPIRLVHRATEGSTILGDHSKAGGQASSGREYSQFLSIFGWQRLKESLISKRC